MDVIHEIIRQSAIGPLSNWFKSLILLLFSAIVVTLLSMLVILLISGSQLHITYGY
jgi:hypothetical protein